MNPVVSFLPPCVAMICPCGRPSKTLPALRFRGRKRPHRRAKGGQNGVLGLVSRCVLAMDFRLPLEFEAVRKLMTKYASVLMSLADACLVRMTEIDARAILVTFDEDFHVYRRNGRQTIPVMMPD